MGNMRVEFNKFYISRTEIKTIEKLLSMFESPDEEQRKLADTLASHIVPIYFRFHKYMTGKLAYVFDIMTDQYFYISNWIIDENS